MKTTLLTSLFVTSLALMGAGCAEFNVSNRALFGYTTSSPASEVSDETTATTTINFPTPLPTSTVTQVTYYLLDQPSSEKNAYCDANTMDRAGYKKALTKKITRSEQSSLSTLEKFKLTLRLAADAQSFTPIYTRIANITFENGIVTMHSADGFAGSSIFYCTWKPFVEKNLEQFSEIRKIEWASE